MNLKTTLTLAAIGSAVLILSSNTSTDEAMLSIPNIESFDNQELALKVDTKSIKSPVDWPELVNEVIQQTDSYIKKVENTEINLTPRDTYYTEQDYLPTIKADVAWDTSVGNRDVVIAVLDTGLDIIHPDIKKNLWINNDEIDGDGIDNDNNGYIDDINGWNFVNNNSTIRPVKSGAYTTAGINHGTVVSGIAAAVGDNNTGITGVAWKASLMSVKVVNNSGAGVTSNLIKGLRYAADNGADVVNVSISVTVKPGNAAVYDADLQSAIDYAYQKGTTVVVSAGNEYVNLNNALRYPVCYKNVIGVAALNSSNLLASFSNYGKNCIDISAPGTGFYSTQYYDGSGQFSKRYGGGWNGTSMSAPVVTGVVALIKSIYPNLTNSEIEKLLESTATTLPSNSDQLGAGLINASGINMVTTNFFEKDSVLTAPRSMGGPDVRLYSAAGNKVRSINAYHTAFRGGVNIATGDVDGDSKNEIITVPISNGGPHVRIFNKLGRLEKQWFAYEENFRGGLTVASGDLDNDGDDEIIVAPRSQGGPDVRIFNANGHKLKSIEAYHPSFRGGVDVATGDVDGDGVAEIITTPISAGGPHVRIFNAQGEVVNEWFAYEENFRGGLTVASGDLDNDGDDEIIVAPRSQGGPDVRIFNANGHKLKSIEAYHPSFRGGVDVATGDVDGDGVAEIITTPISAGGPHVRYFNFQGRLVGQWFAYTESFRGGLSISTLN
ncbi:S8 family serine peptidase [Patescibacteria group bacterium]